MSDSVTVLEAEAVRLHPADNLVVAPSRIPKGARLVREGIAVVDSIPMGHKIATCRIASGEIVRKYGQVIGVATADIAPGAHVHVHNIAMSERRGTAEQAPAAWARNEAPRTFQGYRRKDGRAGTRNYVGVLTSVNCSATVARHIAEAAEKSGLLDQFENVDGIVPITHTSGCGMAGSGEGYDMLRRTLWGTAANPNFGAILLVGLGCEVLQVDRLKDEHFSDGREFHSFTIQDVGGTKRAIAEGLEQLKALLPALNQQQRVEIPASELVLGLQCGGSDGWSGVSSNPALGNASDRLVALGGTVILSETPEIYGAEHLLHARSISPEVSAKLNARLEWWERYTQAHGAEMNNNPSPGNKAGGLSTILEKSLGAVAKAGTSPLNDVIEYAKPLKTRGLVFMDSPGFDPCSATGQVASGATMIAFTTGRGSAYGCKPTPSIKLSSNSAIYEKMKDDIDLDCGTIVTGASTVEQKGGQILDYLLAVASGRQSKSEELGYGGVEFVPWQIGAVM